VNNQIGGAFLSKDASTLSIIFTFDQVMASENNSIWTNIIEANYK
jgi:hypothetical protein